MVSGILDNPRARPLLPEWTDDYRVSDAAFMSAYDASSPQYRASLKTALALHTFISPLSAGFERHEREGYRSGFREHVSISPAPWAAIVFPDKYRAAARVFSASILASLADCGISFVICEGLSPASHILNALEMCGIENVLALPPGKTLPVLDEMTKIYGAGRVILLDSPSLGEIGDNIEKSGRIVYKEKAEPILMMPDPEHFSIPLLELAQGFAPPAQSEGAPYAIYSAMREDEIPRSSLLLRPGLECYWRFEGLALEFFLNRRRSYSLI